MGLLSCCASRTVSSRVAIALGAYCLLHVWVIRREDKINKCYEVAGIMKVRFGQGKRRTRAVTNGL